MMQPTVIWAQRDDYVWLTVEIPNAENLKVDLSSDALKFSCSADSKEYGFEMKFFAPIVKDESKFLKHRLIDFCLKKSVSEEWPRLIEENKKMSWIKVDWSKWQDSDAEDEAGAFDTSNMGGFGGMDMSDMAGMAGMGGMGGMGGLESMMAGMGGMGGMDDFKGEGDSDDEDQMPEQSEKAEQPLIEEVSKLRS